MIPQAHAVRQQSPTASVGADLAHAVAAALPRRRVVVAGGTSGLPRVRRSRVLDALGTALVFRNADMLVGVIKGQRVVFGKCLRHGKPVQWQYWCPHLGIAVDETMPAGDLAEIADKRAWCEAQSPKLIYFDPTDLDFDLMADLANERRKVLS